MPVLKVTSLSVSLPHRRGWVRPVNGVSFAIERGRTLALVGESGCGKTLTALGILQLLPTRARLEADRVELNGRGLLHLPARELRSVRGSEIAMIFQDPSTALNPVITIGEQIAEGVRAHGKVSRRDAWQRAVERLTDVGVPQPEHVAGQYPHELSGGMRQRAVIATAIASEPALLIADEPTTALDVTIQAQIIDLLLQLQEQRQLAMLLITHDLGVVAEMAHEVAVMYAGRIIERTAAAPLFAEPLHPYTRALLDSVPRADEQPDAPRLPTIDGSVPDPSELPVGCAYAPRCSRADQECAAGAGLVEVRPGHWVRCCRIEELVQ